MGIEIGKITIPYYGMFIVLGIAFGVIEGYILIKQYGLEFNNFITLAGGAGLGGMIGAKAFYIMVSASKSDFSEIMEEKYWESLMSGGFVYYGGIVGGFAGVYICGKVFEINSISYMQICIPVIPLVHVFGRLGCQAVGCCYGIPYDGPGAVIYEYSPIAPNNIYLFPVQGVEAFLDLCLAGYLFIYVYRKNDKKLKSIEIYLFFYAALRFIVEFFRFDDEERGIFWRLSFSQWISLLIIIGVTSYIIYGGLIKRRLSY